jgi:diaminohydroxyphosphoribosylaminopyrimidine deaminase/5-amino-6-(5-phosphoribosylamino)uracil reductase
MVVKDGRCIARGATEAYGGRHAERVALDSLPSVDAARGATLYTTLEPCSHYGKQPPCVERVLRAGIARCVIALADPNPLVDRQGIAQLQQHGVEVSIGVCRAEAAAWHAPFLNWQRRQRPLLAAKWAQTLDAQLAYDGGEPRWLSNSLSRRYAHWLRQRYDAIMIGAGTALADLPSLTVRDCPPPRDRHPHRIVVDPGARILQCDQERWQALQTTLFSDAAVTLLVYREQYRNRNNKRLDELQQKNHVVLLPIPAAVEAVLPWLLEQLPQALPQERAQTLYCPPIESILLEGGPRLLAWFFQQQLVDVAHVFIAPYIGGGSRHRLSSPRPLIDTLDFQLVGHHAIGDDVLIEYIGHNLATTLLSDGKG